MKIKYGCEQYAWVMAGCTEPGQPYYNRVEHMMGVSAQSGFSGFESIDKCMFDLYDAEPLVAALEKHQTELAAVVLVDDWLEPTETKEERASADKLIELLATHFPDTVIVLCQMPTTRVEAELEQRQKNLIAIINEISTRAAARGLKCSYHPNSPESSIWRTAEDYKKLLPLLDRSVLGWTPDTGHLAALGIDSLSIIKEYRSIINHVHYKDIADDGQWALMGEGVLDFKAITQELIDSDYDGWIIIEDECPRSENEPDQVTLECGEYLKEELLFLTKNNKK